MRPAGSPISRIAAWVHLESGAVGVHPERAAIGPALDDQPDDGPILA